MTNHSVLKERDAISVTWHARITDWENAPNSSFGSKDQHQAFCTAKDWLQDTGEVLLHHRSKGFSAGPHDAYLEFWGILQAVFIQQDALQQFYYALNGDQKAPFCLDPAWVAIRELRNLSVGHPTHMERSKQVRRSVSGRQIKSYDAIEIVIYSAPAVEYRTIPLGQMLDDYDKVAGLALNSMHLCLCQQLDRPKT